MIDTLNRRSDSDLNTCLSICTSQIKNMSATVKQYLRAKSEVETSMSKAKGLRDQWIATTKGNPVNLTKKEIDLISKSFKNHLLTVKWDCEDLEELVNVCDNENSLSFEEILNAKNFIEEYRKEISQLMNQLDESETNAKLFNKHGLSMRDSSETLQTSVITSMIQAPTSKYERLSNNDGEEVQFDKNQVVASTASIFNNALYDHIEQKDERNSPKISNFNSSQIFNNLSRPVTNVYVNPNENEMILDMLETEYYNPPAGLQVGESRLNYTVRKFFETDRNKKFLGIVAFLSSLPILMLIFLIV